MELTHTRTRHFIGAVVAIIAAGVPGLAAAALVVGMQPENVQQYALPGDTVLLPLDFTVSAQSTEAFDPSQVSYVDDGGFFSYMSTADVGSLQSCNYSGGFCLDAGNGPEIFTIPYGSGAQYPSQIVNIGQTVTFNYATLDLGYWNYQPGDAISVVEDLNYMMNDGTYVSTGMHEWTINIGTAPIVVTPIPAPVWLMGSGILGLGALARKKNN